ncbi:DUF1150 domain-containing protein [Pelagivirga sediminicola]|uniref:DUF1150 domain-containing protein n=1 Tax=Pelagivirga sediminicola TaxID=2170575 RepID=A0A2T7G7A4_9RHOB|nr:DUF1150 family protein [Pelagivirga sediminicola]PVA10289.1 DUF1150 domain-containing protein [Pelagivirga sediminicola]
MDTEFEFPHEMGQRIAYVRSVAVKDLPKDVQSQVGELTTLYAVHSEEGERLALVSDRKMAFVLARQHDLDPVTVH